MSQDVLVAAAALSVSRVNEKFDSVYWLRVSPWQPTSDRAAPALSFKLG
jgi:hypothetical protein